MYHERERLLTSTPRRQARLLAHRQRCPFLRAPDACYIQSLLLLLAGPSYLRSLAIPSAASSFRKGRPTNRRASTAAQLVRLRPRHRRNIDVDRSASSLLPPPLLHQVAALCTLALPWCDALLLCVMQFRCHAGTTGKWTACSEKNGQRP